MFFDQIILKESIGDVLIKRSLQKSQKNNFDNYFIRRVSFHLVHRFDSMENGKESYKISDKEKRRKLIHFK